MNIQLPVVCINITLTALLTSSVVVAEDDFHTDPIILKNDPFVIPTYVSASPGSGNDNVSPEEININGVLFSKNSSLIIVNGTVLELYDEIAGYQLIRLNTRRAVFKKNGIETTLNLPDTMSEAKGK